MFSFLLEGMAADIEQQPLELKQGQIDCEAATVQGSPLPTLDPVGITDALKNSFLSSYFQEYPKKPSSPNLIKNLIVALRTSLRFQAYSSNFVLQSLWKAFKQAPRTNKTLLLLLYGRQQDASKLYPLALKTLKKGKQEISLEEFVEAQKVVAEETIRQVQQADIDYLVRNRRVLDKDKFESYLRSFLEKVKAGGLGQGRARNNLDQEPAHQRE